MPLDDTDLRSRRALLTAGFGALAATVLSALGRPTEVRATNGEPVTIGATRTGTSFTALAVTQASVPGIYGFGVVDETLTAFPRSATIAGHSKGTYEAGVLWYGTTVSGVIGMSDSEHGLQGRSLGTGNGVFGDSSFGRGGRFRGKKAQVRLDPSTDVTHPARGSAGDLFLDASKRLWLCKGGTTWALIA